MSAEPADGVYTHSDILSEARLDQKQFQKQLQEQKLRTIQNIANYTADKKLAVELGLEVFELTQRERVRRSGHHHRLEQALGSFGTARSFSPDRQDIARSALYTFTDYAEIKSRLHEGHLHYGNGATVSGELGHVDQYGIWKTTDVLDEAIRQLPDAPTPDGSEPIKFEKIFGYDEGKRSYDLKEGDESTLFVRMRPIADIIDTAGNKYEIVKRSSGLIYDPRLSRSQRRVLNKARKYQSQKGTDKNEIRKRMQAVGETIIDPFIADKEHYYDNPHLFAVSALYFVMLRNPERTQSPASPE